MDKIKILKEMFKSGCYDWETAIEHSADRIVNNPEVLLWR